jgi:hypothetical protein
VLTDNAVSHGGGDFELAALRAELDQPKTAQHDTAAPAADRPQQR